MAEQGGFDAAAFARDLGYLDKFFDKLEQHAGSLAPASGARLKALIGEERTRWGEIRSIIGGGAPASTTPPSSASSTAGTPGAPRGPQPAAMSIARARPQFTVGPLINKP